MFREGKTKPLGLAFFWGGAGVGIYPWRIRVALFRGLGFTLGELGLALFREGKTKPFGLAFVCLAGVYPWRIRVSIAKGRKNQPLGLAFVWGGWGIPLEN